MHIKKRKILIPIVVIILIAAIAFSHLQTQKHPPSQKNPTSKKSGSNPSTPKVDPCKNLEDPYILPNFQEALSSIEQDPLIDKIPGSGSIRLRFYHFTSGCRIWDSSHIITKGSITPSKSKADIDIWVDSSYAPKINEQGLCATIQEAKTAGHFGSYTDLSKTKLTFRYVKLLPHKSCFGL